MISNSTLVNNLGYVTDNYHSKHSSLFLFWVSSHTADCYNGHRCASSDTSGQPVLTIDSAGSHLVLTIDSATVNNFLSTFITML